MIVAGLRHFQSFHAAPKSPEIVCHKFGRLFIQASLSTNLEAIGGKKCQILTGSLLGSRRAESTRLRRMKLEG